jgi:hypothetical protein
LSSNFSKQLSSVRIRAKLKFDERKNSKIESNKKKIVRKMLLKNLFLYLQSFIGKTIISKLIRGSGEGQWRVL